MAYCRKILNKLIKHQYGWPFNQPVDPAALNIPDYLDIIERPMDFGTILKQLNRNAYTSIEEFRQDVSLVFSNAMTYNASTSDVYIMAQTLQNVFLDLFKDADKKVKKKKEKKNNGELQEVDSNVEISDQVKQRVIEQENEEVQKLLSTDVQ